MKKAKYFNYPQYVEYMHFINSCRGKKYQESEMIHLHHVIPRNVCEESKETIPLNIEDHAKSHFLLSLVFPEKTYEHIANIWSYNLLSKQKEYFALEKIKNSYSGENNPFFGKKHDKETRALISYKLNKYWDLLDSIGAKNYDFIYGDFSKNEKNKRSTGVKKNWGTLNDSEKNSRMEKVAVSIKENGSLKRSKNPASMKCVYMDLSFDCIQDALDFSGLKNEYYLRKSKEFKIIK